MFHLFAIAFLQNVVLFFDFSPNRMWSPIRLQPNARRFVPELFLDLSLAEQIRLGRVNTHFYRMSQFAISETKEIDLAAESCRKMTPEASREIFGLCRQLLEKINLASTSAPAKMVDAFAEFTFPRLVELKIDFGSDRGNDLFDEIMTKNPKIKTLMWEVSVDREKGGDYPMAVYFSPAWVPMQNLTHLKIASCNSSILRKFVACRPNLTHFAARLCDDHGVRGALEEFFARFSKLEERRIQYFKTSKFDFMKSKSLWKLKRSKTLKLGRPPTHDLGTEFLKKIAASFANLGILMVNGVGITADLIDAVQEMQSRQFYDIMLNNDFVDVVEDSVWGDLFSSRH